MNHITLEELAKHNSKDDCWVALHGKVYNLTSFLNRHPGGSKVILREAGKDGTEAFSAIHPPDIIARLLPSHLLVGTLDPRAIQISQKTPDHRQEVEKPPLSAILNCFDFEVSIQ
jgi:L-lactate dehydrogenase (cytochrome)